MINKTIARRYAQALFDIGREQNLVDQFSRDLQQVVRIINSHEELKKVVYDQVVSSEVKKELFDKVLGTTVHPMVINFLKLVTDKFRERYLEQMVDAFSELVDQQNNILKAEVKSAVSLSTDQTKALEDKLSQMTGKNISVNVILDTSLVGGLSVKIGDKVYDGSVVRQLSMLKKHLQQTELGR